MKNDTEIIETSNQNDQI